jgi:hypothetical protein
LLVAAKQQHEITKHPQQQQKEVSTAVAVSMVSLSKPDTSTQSHGIKDVQQLDEVVLSSKSIDMIFQLLRDMNVVEHPERVKEHEKYSCYETTHSVTSYNADTNSSSMESEYSPPIKESRSIYNNSDGGGIRLNRSASC